MKHTTHTSLVVITVAAAAWARAQPWPSPRWGTTSSSRTRSAPPRPPPSSTPSRPRGGRGAALQLDVSQVGSFGDFAGALQKTVKATFGRKKITALVNNAGTGLHRGFAETSESDFDAMLNVHLKGPFFLTQQLLPLIEDGGRILNISTGLSRFSMPGYAAYATMKGGLEVLTRYLAKELGARGISVNTLAPGAIATDFGGGAARDNAAVNGMVASLTALGRVGVPADIGPSRALSPARRAGSTGSASKPRAA